MITDINRVIGKNIGKNMSAFYWQDESTGACIKTGCTGSSQGKFRFVKVDKFNQPIDQYARIKDLTRYEFDEYNDDLLRKGLVPAVDSLDEYNRIERILIKKGEDQILNSYGKTPTLFLKVAFEMAMQNLDTIYGKNNSVRQKESFKNVAKKLFPKVRIK